MKKIILFFPSFNVGGVEKVMINIANTLVNHNFEIYIVVTKSSGALKPLIKNNINVISTDAPLRQSFVSLKNIFKKINADFIISGPDFPNFISIILKIIFKIRSKIIITQHCYFNDETKQLGIHGRLFPILCKILYKRADQIICVSKGIKNMLYTYGIPKNKMIVIYNPFDIKLIQKMSTIQNDNTYLIDKYIVYVGRLDYIKNVIFLLKAFKKLHNYNSELKLVIVGDGIEKKKLELFVTQNHLNKNIIFCGNVSNPYNIIAKSSLLILPSYSESFGNVIVEAMALGITCLSTPTKGVKEISENGKYVYLLKDFYDTEYFVNRIIYALSNKIDSNILKNQALKFDINNTIKTYIENVFTNDLNNTNY